MRRHQHGYHITSHNSTAVLTKDMSELRGATVWSSTERGCIHCSNYHSSRAAHTSTTSPVPKPLGSHCTRAGLQPCLRLEPIYNRKLNTQKQAATIRWQRTRRPHYAGTHTHTPSPQSGRGGLRISLQTSQPNRSTASQTSSTPHPDNPK